ncbi:MAG: polysaccharide biosynthesis tyrosine autokinase [Deltaproteobacteria bacterium]|nr:polysaccharide biosynthesis tyrosine autokinase [Deltaproteobacteria bacterium]
MPENTPNNDPLHIEKEVHLLDYLHVIQRRWRIGLIVFLLIFVGVAVKTYLQTPIYQSSVTLRVGYKQQPSEMVLKMNLENRFSITSELLVLQSYALAEKAAERLNLKWQIEKIGRGIDIHLRGLSAPEDVDQLTVEFTSSTQYRLLNPDGQVVLEGEGGKVAESGAYRCVVEIHSGLKGGQVKLRRLSQGEAVGLVMSGVSAGEIEEGANLIRLSVQGADSMLVADVANALAESYVEQSRVAKSSEAELMLQFIDQQQAELGSQLDRSEQAWHEYRIKTGLDRLSAEGQSLVDVAVELEKRRAGLNIRLERISVFLADFKQNRDDFTTVGDLPDIGEYISQLFALQANRLDLLRKFTPAHPDVVEVDNQISQLREKIYSTATLAKRRIIQQLADVKVSLGKSSRLLEQVPEEELELVRLSRTNQVNAELYSYLLQRQQETRITAAATSSNIDIIDRAQVPGAPIKPNKKKNLALGLILGLMLGVGLTFLLDYIDRTIKDEDDVQEKLGLSVIGTIPKLAFENGEVKNQLVTQLEPLSPASEAFLALRTNLLYIVTNQKHRIVMITSCLPDEGKSTIAVNLATAMAQTGAKTLLIGCDLRRPSLYGALDQSAAPGLTDLLANRDRKAIRHIKHLGLDFIPAGTEPPNPTQMLNSNVMKRLLLRVRERYDYVIVDVPPLLPVSDALILASQVDLNVIVIESCRIPEKLAKRALRSLQNHGAEVAGVILNDKTGRGAKYYGAYSYYEGKYYQGYYRSDEPEPTPALWRRVLTRVWGFVNG